MDHCSKVSESSSLGEACAEFSVFMDKLGPLLDDLKQKKMMDKTEIYKAIESLEVEFCRAQMLLNSTSTQSSPLRQMEDVTQNLGRSLGLVLFASHEVSMANKEKIEALRKEMMNSRFDLVYEPESEFSEIEDDSISSEQEIVEVGRSRLEVKDVVFQLSCGADDEFRWALMELDSLVRDDAVTNETVDEESVVSILCNRLASNKSSNRTVMIRILTSLAQKNDDNKETMTEVSFLSVLVKSLARDVEEQREAVRLLSILADVAAVGRRLGRIQGCIVMLVSIFHGKDQEASNYAGILLNVLSTNTQFVLNMAEAGYYKPLVHHLNQGTDMSKILVTTALSRIVLTDQGKASLGKHGAIQPLVKMFTKGNLEAKLSALNALHKLSSLKENTKLLIESDIVVHLLQLLFSVTSVLVILREPASAILAMIAQYENILVKPDVAQQMLSLLNLSSPVIQGHLLSALTSIASHASAVKVRKKMKDNGAIQLLLPFLIDGNSKNRISVLNLIYTLSKNDQEDLQQQLGETYISILSNIVSSTKSEIERAAAVGILSNLPADDRKVTDILRNENLLPTLISQLSSMLSITSSTEVWLAENIAGVLIRFTVSSDKKLQQFSVNHGLFTGIVKLLMTGSVVAKSRASTCLAQLSKNTLPLTKSRKAKWFCTPPSRDGFCEVHDGFCSVKSTFCLIKAEVAPILIRILEGREREADDAVLSTLMTLLDDKILESGSNFIAKISGIQAVIKVLEFGSSKAREKALWILNRAFRFESCRTGSAQAMLIDLAQNGEPRLKPEIAKLLAQLELLQDQSSYF